MGLAPHIELGKFRGANFDPPRHFVGYLIDPHSYSWHWFDFVARHTS
jgi:hypothetical protein